MACRCRHPCRCLGLLTPTSTLFALVVVVRDVTEQRLAQATLAEVEGRLEEGEALAHVGSWLWDVRTGAVQWSNEFHRIHGVDPLDFDGTFESHVDVIHPEDRERVRAELDGSASSGCTFIDTYRVVRPDGEIRVVRVRAQAALDRRERSSACAGSVRTSPSVPTTTSVATHQVRDPRYEVAVGGVC